MGDVMATLTDRNAVEDVCDHCHRGFRRLRTSAVCPSCGLDNVRESAMLAPARERAVMPTAKARRRSVPLKPNDGLNGAPKHRKESR